MSRLASLLNDVEVLSHCHVGMKPEVPDDEVLEYLESSLETIDDASEFFEILSGFCEWLDGDSMLDDLKRKLFLKLIQSDQKEEEQQQVSEQQVLDESLSMHLQEQTSTRWRKAMSRFVTKLQDYKQSDTGLATTDHNPRHHQRQLISENLEQFHLASTGQPDGSGSSFNDLFSLAEALFPSLMYQSNLRPTTITADVERNSIPISRAIFADALRGLGGRAEGLATEAMKADELEVAAASATAVPNEVLQAVAPLMVLCPPESDPYIIAFVYIYRCSHDLDLTAQWILDKGYDAAVDAKHKEDKHQASKLVQRAAQEKKERNNQRRLILSKFDERLEKIPESAKGIKSSCTASDIVGKGRRDLFKTRGSGTVKGEKQTRYLDGHAVLMKGKQKFIVESVKDEWDGGSRGKVKTKGKRGKGFV